jgi:preprotein translocase subunit SecA
MLNFFAKLGSGRKIEEYRALADLVETFDEQFRGLSDADLKAQTEEFKRRLSAGETIDQVMPEAFAAVREASHRTLRMRHFPVQLMGGAALHQGNVAEMSTGEGKTLVATLPAYVNALSGEGVHVITVNDYLARRDAIWMGQVYHALGLTVSCIVHEGAYAYDPSFRGEEKADETRDEVGSFKVIQEFLRPIERKDAYRADITYGTNHEFGFDYLRDNLAIRLADKVQRGHSFAIIDEVDSILIDEARTPLIISAPDIQSSEYYKTFARIVERLTAEEDYAVDEKLKSVSILDSGIEKVQKLIGVENLFDPEHSRLVHYLQESLRAKALFRRDKDYVVKGGQIFIVDEFTGRILEGRRYSGGLHQAIEAKEGVFVKEESRTYAQITIQNYFRLYKKISGMTGTASTSAEEFHKVYNLEVVKIPTNRDMIRKDLPDRVYKNQHAKYMAVVREVEERHTAGQPILIGTASIAHNEALSTYLHKAGIRHELLNAKNNEREGEIIAQAGKPGAVTVATNMAGRGVDIILGGNPPSEEDAKKIRECGGLHVIGTERHEARRIDNQLRGRAGRQGDPGSTQFYLSLEDDLVRIFGGDRIGRLMETLNFPEETPIESKMVTKAVDQAQQKVEGMNFDIRKHLLDFDDVLNKQRSAVYARRDAFLDAAEKNDVIDIVRETLNRHIERMRTEAEALQTPESDEETAKRYAAIAEAEKRTADLPDKLEPDRTRMVAEHLVRISDTLWVEHLENLEALRDFVNLRAYGQHDPVVEYRREGHLLYSQMNANFDSFVFQTIFPLFDLDLTEARIKPREEKNPPVGGRPPAGHEDIGRNDPCWCGSGKKYKKCHGK